MFYGPGHLETNLGARHRRDSGTNCTAAASGVFPEKGRLRYMKMTEWNMHALVRWYGHRPCQNLFAAVLVLPTSTQSPPFHSFITSSSEYRRGCPRCIGLITDDFPQGIEVGRRTCRTFPLAPKFPPLMSFEEVSTPRAAYTNQGIPPNLAVFAVCATLKHRAEIPFKLSCAA